MQSPRDKRQYSKKFKSFTIFLISNVNKIDAIPIKLEIFSHNIFINQQLGVTPSYSFNKVITNFIIVDI